MDSLSADRTGRCLRTKKRSLRLCLASAVVIGISLCDKRILMNVAKKGKIMKNIMKKEEKDAKEVKASTGVVEMKTKGKITTKTVTTFAMLIACNILLNEFLGLRLELIKINFGFVTLVLAGMIYGVKGSVTVAVLGDILGLIVFPPVGAPHIGFTVITGLVGAVYGLCLYCPVGEEWSRKKMIARSALAAFLVTGVLYTGLNSFLLGYLYGESYIIGAMPLRILKNVVLFAMQVVMIPSMFLVKERLGKAGVVTVD